MTYDEQTQKVNIAVTGGSGVVTISASDTSSVLNTLRIPLGFDAGQTITQASNTDGNNVAYTNTARHLRLMVDNITSNNIYANTTTFGSTKQTNLQRVSVVIPITETRNEFQFYDNQHGYKIKLPNLPSINELNVKLTDANGNVVDLHNVPWGFEVIFYEWNRNPWKNR